nr:hypothetical protein [uncultured Chryseobacterium sp.]
MKKSCSRIGIIFFFLISFITAVWAHTCTKVFTSVNRFHAENVLQKYIGRVNIRNSHHNCRQFLITITGKKNSYVSSKTPKNNGSDPVNTKLSIYDICSGRDSYTDFHLSLKDDHAVNQKQRGPPRHIL